MTLHRLVIVLYLLLSVTIGSSSLFAEDDEATSESSSQSRYVDMKPAFIANYGGKGKLRYLKTEVSLRVSGDDAGENSVRHHMPQLRHVIVMLLTQQNDEDINTMEGKELLRQNALAQVQEVLEGENGESYVDDLLFTSFIVQR